MKQFLALAALALAAAQPAAARNGETFDTKTLNGETVSANVVFRFNTEFKGATGIWNVEKNYNEVLFFWKNTLMDSFYDRDGNLIGTFHDIAPSELSADVRHKLASWYKGYEIKAVNVMQRDGQDDIIYVKVQSAKHLRVLQVSTEGEVTEFQCLQ